jgi:hypothetical protein
MAWNFADSFDPYASAADMVNGYWDSGLNPGNAFLNPGRFAGSRAISLPASTTFTKASSVNDPVHHFVVSWNQNLALSGTSLGFYLQLTDNVTAQCSIVFRSDGAILLTAGGPTGTVLATYTGAVTAANTWYAFEFEVAINATTGSFTVRKNGNTVADFSATALNTAPSGNAYANKLVIGSSAIAANNYNADDLFWRSGAATGSWLGDIRCYSRPPQADVSVQFAGAPSSINQTVNGTASNLGAAASVARAVQFVASYSGVLTGGIVNIFAASTGNMKFALYNGTGTTLLATSNPLANPPLNTATPFTFPTPPAIVKGQTYYLANDQDSTINCNIANTGATPTLSATLAYASFPPATLAGWTSGAANAPNMSVTFTGIANSSLVGEPQQDGVATYVFDSNPGDADLYSIAGAPSTPATVIATVIRGYMQKSDAGTRTAAVRLKSGATTVATPTIVLSNSGFQWAWRMDLTDPATGAAWTPAAVNAAQIGPTVVA